MRSRGTLKDLKDSKLILNETKLLPWSSRINLVPFTFFRRSLFPKPVAGQELFLAVSYSKPALILYPSLGILTTHTTIVCHGQYFKCKTPEGGYYRNLEKKWEEENLMNIHFCSHLQIWNSNSWVDACSSSLLLLFTDLNSLLKIVIYDLKLKKFLISLKLLIFKYFVNEFYPIFCWPVIPFSWNNFAQLNKSKSWVQNILWEESVFIFQFLNDEMHNHVLFDIIMHFGGKVGR